jgi:hypothetical protein
MRLLTTRLLCAVALPILLVACGEEKPKAVEAVPVTSAVQLSAEIEKRLDEQKAARDRAAIAATEQADRERLVGALQDPLDKWGNFYYALPGKTQKEVTEIAAKMQALRAEMAITPTNSCTGAAREVIFQGMDQVHAVLRDFATAPPSANEELARRMGIGEGIARRGSGDLQSCLQATGRN